ncbi:DUF3137 domain-containing protein [Evansella halocellulosilytica]|uniref:DUF3137 domain-containing protein n=1 Tax=Evansella halocellulosilytica TaxID=2011013 RepID=UPI000BB6FB57|nr:DUF3137 domain-containing protein [Evansella halocellulosilytica]
MSKIVKGVGVTKAVRHRGSEEKSDNSKEIRKDEVYGLQQFAKSRGEYDEFYDAKLGAKVEQIEMNRQKAMGELKKKAIPAGIGVVIALMIHFLIPSIGTYVWMAVGAYIAYLGYTYYNNQKEIGWDVKDMIVTDLVEFMNPNFTYEKNKYVSKSQFNYANVFKQNPDRYSGEDLIKGYLEDEEEGVKTQLSFSEATAEKRIKYKDKNGRVKYRYETIFKGLFFKVDFNKDTEGVTIVVPKQKRSIGTKVETLIGKHKNKQKLEDIELENVEFMEKFTVRSTDGISSRYILTPAFMNRLLEFSDGKPREKHADEVDGPIDVHSMSKKDAMKQAWKQGSALAKESQESGYKPYFSFRDGTMYFMLATGRKHFDFNLMQKLDREVIYDYFRDINRALELVDELNLNLRIWSKN